MNLRKMMKVLTIKYLQIHGLIKKNGFNDRIIDKILDIQCNQLLKGGHMKSRLDYSFSITTLTSYFRNHSL